MSNTKEAVVSKIVEVSSSRSSDAVERLGCILAIVKDAGMNLEVMEHSLICQVALSVGNYAERTGRLDGLMTACDRASDKCDYSRFDEAYIRRCRGMHAGGLM